MTELEPNIADTVSADKRAPADWHPAILDRPPARGPWKNALHDPLANRKQEVLAFLRAQTATVFGLFDAARDDRILELFHSFGKPANLPDDRRKQPPPDQPEQCEYECLYVGKMKDTTGSSGPWLTRLPTDSELVRALVREGWGRAWGYYLISNAPLNTLRRHFRRFLMTQLPNGKAVWFRLADPRIMWVAFDCFLPNQRSEFLNDAQVIIESHDAVAWQCTKNSFAPLADRGGNAAFAERQC